MNRWSRSPMVYDPSPDERQPARNFGAISAFGEMLPELGLTDQQAWNLGFGASAAEVLPQLLRAAVVRQREQQANADRQLRADLASNRIGATYAGLLGRDMGRDKDRMSQAEDRASRERVAKDRIRATAKESALNRESAENRTRMTTQGWLTAAGIRAGGAQERARQKDLEKRQKEALKLQRKTFGALIDKPFTGDPRSAVIYNKMTTYVNSPELQQDLQLLSQRLGSTSQANAKMTEAIVKGQKGELDFDEFRSKLREPMSQQAPRQQEVPQKDASLLGGPANAAYQFVRKQGERFPEKSPLGRLRDIPKYSSAEIDEPLWQINRAMQSAIPGLGTIFDIKDLLTGQPRFEMASMFPSGAGIWNPERSSQPIQSAGTQNPIAYLLNLLKRGQSAYASPTREVPWSGR